MKDIAIAMFPRPYQTSPESQEPEPTKASPSVDPAPIAMEIPIIRFRVPEKSAIAPTYPPGWSVVPVVTG